MTYKLDDLMSARLTWWQSLGLSSAAMCLAFAADITFDHFQSFDFIETVFYILPIAIAAWTGGFRLGVVAAIVATALEAGASYYSFTYGHRHDDIRAKVIPTIALFEGVTLVSIAFLLGKLRDYQDRLKELASRDPLTGVFNSRVFDSEVKKEIERMRRAGSLRPMTLVFLDVDDFKGINDKFGHSMGDRVLTHVADTLARNVRQIDFVARLGGDEFGVLMPNTTEEAAKVALDRTVLMLETTSPVPVTLSVGLASFLDVPVSVDAVLGASDDAMYQAKNSGKNKVVAHVHSGDEVEVTGEYRLRPSHI
jgi:diguanylate cyclase (GGDEF)-like protein